ncbi:MAG: hypothetical protein ABI577_04490 [bacterium]
MTRRIPYFLLAAAIGSFCAFALTTARAAETTFSDPANDAVLIADDVLAFDPDINPGGAPVAGHPADITSVTANVGSTIDVCVLRPNKTAAGPITHVEIILLGVNLEARWKLDNGVLSTFVEDLDGTPVGGSGITITSVDGGKTVCLHAPLALATSVTGLQAVTYDRPTEGQQRGWDRTSVFAVQLQAPTATPTSTPTAAATTTTATSTPTASPTATASATNTPTTAPTLSPATNTPVPTVAAATATSPATPTVLVPRPPATGTGPGESGREFGYLYLALVLCAAGATAHILGRRRG